MKISYSRERFVIHAWPW